jgi:hypothetical protein
MLVSMLAACGDDGPAVCGVAASTPEGGATIGVAGDSASYVGFIWGANNDCPATGSSVVSVTLRGHQSDATDFGLGLCLRRPDRIGEGAIDLADDSLVLLVGASAHIAPCDTSIAPDATPTGTVTFAGFCTAAGTRFLMTLSGQVAGIRTCGDQLVPVTMMLGGRVLVVPQG